jgi:hypothetical protein
MVGVGPLFDEELAESPMAMEGGVMKSKVIAKCLETFPGVQEKLDGGHIAEISAMLEERDIVGIESRGCNAVSEQIDDPLGSAFA